MLMRIGGKDTGGSGGGWIDVKNPATGVFIDRVPSGTPDDVAFAFLATKLFGHDDVIVTRQSAAGGS